MLLLSDAFLFCDEIYKIFKDSITCPLCINILINPVMCLVCQKTYCKRCIDNWSKNNKKCPNGYENPNYQRSILTNDILSKLSNVKNVKKQLIMKI